MSWQPTATAPRIAIVIAQQARSWRGAAALGEKPSELDGGGIAHDRGQVEGGWVLEVRSIGEGASEFPVFFPLFASATKAGLDRGKGGNVPDGSPACPSAS